MSESGDPTVHCPVCESPKTRPRRGKTSGERVCWECGFVFTNGESGVLITGPAPELFPEFQ
jgi:transcription initiation factor TFIIIB Brf1 subunit/transcription initiation factor TFIIB